MKYLRFKMVASKITLSLGIFTMLSCKQVCDCEDTFIPTCDGLKSELTYETEDIQLLKSQIIGEWKLICATNPWTGETTSYTDADNPEILVFKSNGELVYRNGQQITVETTWDIKSIGDLPGSGINRVMLILNDKPDIFELGPKKLRINQTPYDGLDSYYAKN
jgi:hypothetical protein